jgi:hypothetical protein
MRKHLMQASTWLVAFLVVGGLFVATSAQAEEALRWKFKVGEKLDYDMVQQMSMEISGAPFPKPLTTEMRQEMNMTWDVQGVDEKTGEAVIKQKFDRVKMKMNSPMGAFDYDSKSEEAPTGLGAIIAPMYKAMTAGEFEITMTSRGEVKDVKIPEGVLAALKNSPAAGQMGDIASSEGFKKMISQGALVLPKDPPKKGDTWTTKVEMKNAAVGTQTIETTYRYEGTKDIKGATFALIKPTLKMEFGAAVEGQKPAMSIKEQSSDGEVLFNIAAGRLQSTTLNQKVTIQANAAGQPIEQKIDQKIEVKVSPAGEKKANEEGQPKAAEPKKAEEPKKASQ